MTRLWCGPARLLPLKAARLRCRPRRPKKGIRSKDDYPPPRTFDLPVQSGALAGHVLAREDYDHILDIYYQKRGWSPDGVPPEPAAP